MSSTQRNLYALIVVALILGGVAFGIMYIMVPNIPNLDEVPEVTITGSTGTSVNVTLTEMTAMSTISRNGSFQNSYGNVRGSGEYSGVLISDLIELVGGMEENDTVKVIASDGYSQTFEYSKVYPNAIIWGIQGDMVLAYKFNETIVPDYEEGFRLMFLPEDGYYSNADANATTDPDPYAAGPQCVSDVNQIVVIPEPGPEPVLFILNYNDQTLQYTMSELVALGSVSGEGGYKRNSGAIVGPDSYQGVPFTTLMTQVLSLPSNYTVIVRAGDDWISEYSKAVIEGTVNGYSPTGDSIGDIACTMILAYEMNSAPISIGDGGPLRVVFLNEDGNLTDGFNWAKNVVNITIVEEPLSAELLSLQEARGHISVDFMCATLISEDENK
ncbi:MAG: molybdopterin-dependent oxidoreductase [Candidatus Thorarchaeota archaeon]